MGALLLGITKTPVSPGRNSEAEPKPLSKLVKSAVAAANNAFESVQKAGKQAVEVADANFQAMSSSAVRATKSKKA